MALRWAEGMRLLGRARGAHWLVQVRAEVQQLCARTLAVRLSALVLGLRRALAASEELALFQEERVTKRVNFRLRPVLKTRIQVPCVRSLELLFPLCIQGSALGRLLAPILTLVATLLLTCAFLLLLLLLSLLLLLLLPRQFSLLLLLRCTGNAKRSATLESARW